jgi:hypothetical protein
VHRGRRTSGSCPHDEDVEALHRAIVVAKPCR